MTRAGRGTHGREISWADRWPAPRPVNPASPTTSRCRLRRRWKATTGAERDLWQGLAQIAVGLTHAQRGNTRGAVSLLRRGADRIRPYAAAAPYGVDVAAAVMSAEGLADRIERLGAGGLAPSDLRPRLFDDRG